LGADPTPVGINIFPRDFAAKETIKEYLEAFNTRVIADGREAERVIFIDMAELITEMTATLLNAVAIGLIVFAAISLFVSSIMIGIITYVSVLERTKEIGILRSLGARKKDITRVFNAETAIVGLTAGGMGVGIAFAASLPINFLVERAADLPNITTFTPLHIAFLILGSTILTLIAGFIPAKIASRKDPVAALRVE